MDAKELIRAGKLSEARTLLVEAVKSSPANVGSRTLLFQVLCFSGEWDRAERHLDAIAAQDVKAETGIQVYKNLIHAERERIEVIELNRRPSFLPKTPPYTEMVFAAREKLLEKSIDQAEELYKQIDAQRPVVAGTSNGQSFSGFRDTDAFLAMFLEAFVHEHYIWIPFESIRELSITAPRTLFDLLWIPAQVTAWNGLTLACYLPVLYPNSFRHQDDRVKLGRMTDWTPLGGPFAEAVGQHVFQIGDEEIAILDLREVLFKSPDTAENDETNH